jgi:FADH2 O2-dependent halogenase
MWVIPFDNHLRATSDLCSIGLQLDPRIHPQPDCSPEEEFRRFIAQYPAIAPQFENARPVRDWVRTGRLQYSSRQTVGYRWCLTSHAAGFIDPLFSRGLSNSLETAHALVHRLLTAIETDDFALEHFAYMQEFEQGLLDFNDDLVANAYVSFGNWKLWDAWFRIWSFGQFIATFEVNRAYARFLDTRDTSMLEPLERPWWRGRKMPTDSPYAPVLALLQEVNERVQMVQRGEADADETADDLMRMLQESDFVPPAWGLADADSQWTDASLVDIAKALHWARHKAPKGVGDLVNDGLTLFAKKRFSPGEFAVGEELKHALARWPLIGRRFRVPEPR